MLICPFCHQSFVIKISFQLCPDSLSSSPARVSSTNPPFSHFVLGRLDLLEPVPLSVKASLYASIFLVVVLVLVRVDLVDFDVGYWGGGGSV